MTVRASSGTSRWLVCGVTLFTLAVSSLSGVAQDVSLRSAKKPADSQELTLAAIRARADEAERSAEIDPATRRQIADLYSAAVTQIGQGDDEILAAQTYRARADQQQLRQLAGELRAECDRLNTTVTWLPTSRELARLESLLGEKQDELAGLKQSLAELERTSRQRGVRRSEIIRSLPEVREQIEEAAQRLDLPAAVGEHPLMVVARKTELRTRKRFLEHHVGRLTLELEAYDAEDAFDVPRLQRQILARRVELVEAECQQLTDRQQKLLTEQTQQSVTKARDELAQTHPQLRPYAEHNQELAEQTQELTKSISSVAESVQRIKSLRDDVDQKFVYVREKVDQIGQSTAIGQLLRKTRTELPDVTQYRRNLQARRELIDDLSLKTQGLEDELKPLVNPAPLVAQILAKAEASNTTASASADSDSEIELRAAASSVLERQRDYIKNLKVRNDQYFKLLVELDANERQLIRTVEEFSRYIDGRVLWIRSDKILAPWALEGDVARELSVFSPRNWASVLRALHGDFRRNPEMALLALLLFFGLLRVNRVVARELRHTSDEARRPTCTDLWLTSRALGLTFVRSMVFPAVPAYLGWRLHEAAAETAFAIAMADGLLAVALVGWPLRMVSLICKRDGLAEAHLNWPRHSCDVVRRHLRWMMPAGLSLLFINVVLEETNREAAYTTTERLLFIAGMLVVAAYFRRVLKPFGGVLHEYVINQEKQWLDRLQQVWYFAGLLIPVSLAIMSFLGYDYTARQIAWKLHATGWLGFGLLVIHGVMLRQVAMRHRKLSHQLNPATAFEPIASDDLSAKYYSLNNPTAAVRQKSESTDLVKMMNQTGQLIRTIGIVGFLAGAWLIWVDVIPALKFFGDYALWYVEVTQIVNGVAKTVQEPITIPQVGLALLLAICTWVGVKNLPGLLDFTLLERLPLDKSVRYAINALASYALTLVGTVVVFGTLGITWGKVQWLATALTFGLAFGLQEVFANFVSGIIILFERPLRVGDVVTIGEVTGIVSQIRMRATTITNWDRQEFVVPNKEFITGRLLNWTLSDSVNRIVITAGVAYGSNPDHVRKLILDTALRHQHVLREPAPSVTFESFGDSNINFTLRAFLPTMDVRLGTINDLHTQIYKTLNDHKIEIAFPQQDIHLRSLPHELLNAFNSSRPSGHQEPPNPLSRAA